MAYKTVAETKDSISGILIGTNLNNVKNLNKALERSARELTSLIYIPESSAQSQVTLYDGVFDYIAPTDIFGSSLVDFRPQGISRNPAEFDYKQTIEQFDRTKVWVKSGYQLTFEFVKGIGRLRVSSTRPNARLDLDPFSDTTGWTVGGSASTLTQDSTVYWQAPSALRFTLTGASTGTLTKTISANDLTNYKNVGVAFLAIRTPIVPTSIEIRLGSDASNYYSVTQTTGFLGAWTTNEWNVTSFDLSTATTVGSPVITKINYAQILITHASTTTNFYIGDFWISLPSPHTLYYQSDAFFQALGQNPSRTITNDADSIILNDQALVIYEYFAAINIAEQQGGSFAEGLIQSLQQKINGVRGYRGVLIQPGLLDLYRAANPSQEMRTVGNYYEDQ